MTTSISRRTILAGGLATAAALSLAACGKASESSGSSDADAAVDGITVSGDTATIAIGATPEPHVTILQWVQDNLAADAGLSLDIKEINDYQTPNSSLNDGSLAANFYQTPNFLAQQIQEKGYDFTSLADVHIEPMGIYSASATSIDQIAEGSSITLNNDPANMTRGYRLLETAGLITLDDSSSETLTDTDVTGNPKNLQFYPLDAGQIPASMPDAELAIINGNYALGAGLKPSEDALVLEQGGADSPYANELVVRTKDKDNEYLVKLAELMNSDDLKNYIEQTWTDGSVVPAF